MRTIIKLLVVVGLLAAAGYYWLLPMFGGKQEAGMQDFSLPVQMATVSAKPLDVTIESVGTLMANESVVLRPEVAGRVTGIYFTEGQQIKKGAKLFQIDDRMARAELKQAESNLRLARLNFERFRKLSATGAATKQRYDEAAANLGVSQANADLARTRIDVAGINAPFDGVVGLRHVSPGDYVNMGQELANFVSYDPMKVDFAIPEISASKLAIGQKIQIRVDALPDEVFTGEVFALDPQLDVNGRAVSVRARVPNQSLTLKPGYFARVVLNISRKESALMVPEGAIVPQGDAKLVVRVAPDGTTQMVPVTLGERLAGEVEILSGLEGGDKVVTSGQMKLRPGAKVVDIATMQPQAGSAPHSDEAPQNAMPAAGKRQKNSDLTPEEAAISATSSDE